jgi:hypothetical protein
MVRLRWRYRIALQLTIALAIIGAIAAVSLRYTHRVEPGEALPPGPRQIIMSQRLSEGIPPELAGLTRRQVSGGQPAVEAIEALHEGPLPLTDAQGGRYGSPGELGLWLGALLSADEARHVVTRLRERMDAGELPWRSDAEGADAQTGRPSGAVLRGRGAGEAVAVYSEGRRLVWLRGKPARVDQALSALRKRRGR